MSNQTCFRCSGLGITYEFEGGFGEKSQCKGCVGKGTIPSSYLKCKKCKGKGQIYKWEIHQYVLFAMIQDLQKKK